MATIEVVTLGMNGGSAVQTNHVNISGIVGLGQRNDINDVMLIQALFKLISLDISIRNKLGFQPDDFPEPTGVFDKKTIQVIRKFELKMRNGLLNVDGKIHPANYKNRFLGNAFNRGSRLMIITQLNLLAYETQANRQGDSVEAAIRKLAPSIVLTKIPFNLDDI